MPNNVMRRNPVILCDRVSDSARILSDATGYRIRNPRTSRTRLHPDTPLVGWGVGNHEINTNQFMLNRSVTDCLNKHDTLVALDDVDIPVPEFTADCGEAINHQWARTVCRDTLTGHGGAGITFIKRGEAPMPPAAKLYVEYKKGVELRIHAMKQGTGNILWRAQQKKRRNDREYEGDARLIKNYDNGWTFGLVNGDVPAGMIEDCTAALRALDVDFAAFDIRWNKRTNEWWFLEANTAPGLDNDGPTVDWYVRSLAVVIGEDVPVEPVAPVEPTYALLDIHGGKVLAGLMDNPLEAVAYLKIGDTYWAYRYNEDLNQLQLKNLDGTWRATVKGVNQFISETWYEKEEV